MLRWYSTLTFKKAVEIYQAYLDKREIEKNAESEIIDFLGWSEPLESSFAEDVRIVLASANFSKELTTAVMWLNKRNLDIRCVRLQPYNLDGQVLVDVEQIIPLPEAEDYQIRIKEQSEEKRRAESSNLGSDRKKNRYLFAGNIYGTGRLVLAVITQYLKDYPSTTFHQLKYDIFPDALQGSNVVSDFEEAQRIFDRTGHRRHFIREDEVLLTFEQLRVAISNQWGIFNVNNFIDRAKELGYKIEPA
jgi:hypothetical protein